jgi:hypothetical protein
MVGEMWLLRLLGSLSDFSKFQQRKASFVCVPDIKCMREM